MRTLLTFSGLLCLAGTSFAAPPVTALAYSPDGARLAAGMKNEVAVVDAKSGDVSQKLTGLPGRVTAVAWGKSHLAVASGEPGKSGVVTVYDSSLKPLGTLPPHKDSVYAVAFSADGSILATAGYDRVVRLWNVTSKLPTEPVLSLTDHSDAVYGLAFHPTKPLLATGSADRAVKVWDVNSGKRLYTLGDSTDWVYSVSWSPDGTRLAAGGVDKSLRVWKVDETGGTLERATFAHAKSVLRLGFAGGKLYSAGEDRVVKAWDPATLAESKTYSAEGSDVLGFAVRSDGSQYAIGLFDGALRLVDPTSGTAVAALPAKPKPPVVTSMSPFFVPRGRTTRIRLFGERIETIKEFIVPAVPAASAVRVGPNEFDLTLPPDTPVGPLLTFRVKNSSPYSGGDALFVSRYPLTEPVNGIVKTPGTVSSILERPGDEYRVQFAAVAGQQLGMSVAAFSSVDAVLTVTDPSGRVVAETSRRQLGFTAGETGTYALSVRDREFRGGSNRRLVLEVGDIPVVTGVFPLVVPPGAPSTVHLSGANLPVSW